MFVILAVEHVSLLLDAAHVSVVVTIKINSGGGVTLANDQATARSVSDNSGRLI